MLMSLVTTLLHDINSEAQPCKKTLMNKIIMAMQAIYQYKGLLTENNVLENVISHENSIVTKVIIIEHFLWLRGYKAQLKELSHG